MTKEQVMEKWCIWRQTELQEQMGHWVPAGRDWRHILSNCFPSKVGQILPTSCTKWTGNVHVVPTCYVILWGCHELQMQCEGHESSLKSLRVELSFKFLLTKSPLWKNWEQITRKNIFHLFKEKRYQQLHKDHIWFLRQVLVVMGGYRAGFCKKLPETSPTSERANTSSSRMDTDLPKGEPSVILVITLTI